MAQVEKSIKFHPAVEKDAQKLTASQEKLAIKAAKRIAQGRTKLEDIVPMEEAAYKGCKRWKPSNEERTHEGDIRIVFRETSDAIEILGVGERKHIYSQTKGRV